MWNKTSGLNQFYNDRGNEDGIPVIFIHGFPFDSSTWENQVVALPSNFRPVVYDVRGHGQSEVGDIPYSLEFLVDDLFALIENLELQQPILCGLSMGGYIALRAYEKWPGLFKALILCDTRAEGDSNTAKINRAHAIKTIWNGDIKKYAEDSVKNLFWSENILSKIPEIVQIKSIIEKTSPDALCAALMALAARTDSTEILTGINIPTLIIVGEHDKITPPIAAEFLHENINGSELVIIKKAGHLSNLENPEEFNKALLHFLENMQ